MASAINVVTGRGGLTTLNIANQAASAQICLMGAHVLSYIPRGQEDVLFLSKLSQFSREGKAIRGGVPICWPWFGPADREQYPNATTSHGFIRQYLWRVAAKHEVSPTRTEVVLAVDDSVESRRIWPHDFKLEMTVSVGETLELSLTTMNPGAKPLEYSEAFHTYYRVGECTKIKVHGFDGKAFIDKAPATPPAPNPQQGDVVIKEETDRVYLHIPGEAVIEDPVLKREIHITKTGSDTAVIWNPWIAKAHRMPDFDDEEYHQMVCVENCNVDYDSVTLQPGESHTMHASIAVKPLA